MKILHMVTFTLLVIGGLNWLLTAFSYNVVEMVLGAGQIATVVYVLVGLSAIWEVITHKQNCRNCNPGGSAM
ncbi:hypothetical protein A2W48_02170 [Candidatus Giovannonibacteria bacterium RIFCSPHIGHO2_12_44_12]|uniref:DUF378 domain-containing protein n=1 Tax=Candidatus Giovannonibacteria bacterium RIFCSPHIGHO2_12_44_12 TaxID=1798340 RepID=A0A1F5X298_9BACT|nr:MAG: hypothetical protein A2W48_02170 [Candidatus Giovannonibacteria bacterium RIFCSPHIGHO2_12_44_12]